MKRVNCVTFLLLLTVALTAGVLPQDAPKNPRFLAGDGITDCRIFFPERAPRAVMFAVDELREHLREITGADFAKAWREPGHWERGFVLSIAPKCRPGEEQNFTIEEKAAPAPRVYITGNSALAVLYGVYEYLDGLGVRWFTPGSEGTNMPHGDLALKPSLRRMKPLFAARGIDFSWGGAGDFGPVENAKGVPHYEYDLWLLRNRMHFQRSMHGGHWFGFNKTEDSGAHSLQSKAGLSKETFANDPERHAMVTRDFKKQRVRGGQICFTHPKNVQTAIDNAVKHFNFIKSRDNDLLSLSDSMDMALADGPGICECPECTKVAGDGPYSRDRLVWSYMNKVARGIAERCPGKKIHLFAPYFDLTRPPEGMKIEPNVCAISCRSIAWDNTPENQASYPFRKVYREQISATSRAGAEMRSYDYAIWQGAPQPLDILDAAEAYRELGYKHYHLETMDVKPQLWPILWAISRTVWGGEQAHGRDALREFCLGYYGVAAGKDVYRMQLELGENGRKTPRRGYGGLADYIYMLPNDFIKRWRPVLRTLHYRAAGKEVARLEQLEKSMEFAFRMAETYRAECNALNTLAPADIKKFHTMLVATDKYWLDNNLSQICAPWTLKVLRDMRKIDFGKKYITRSELADSERWMNELFAAAKVEKVRHMYKLPEYWQFRIDADDDGEKLGWEKPEFDAGSWRKISTWDFIENQGLDNVDGRLYYRCEFIAPKFPAGEKVYLRIGSADDTGEVFVNGKLAGVQNDPDHWDRSFEMDVTSLIKPGEKNVIVVRVFDCVGGGGVWRPSALYCK